MAKTTAKPNLTTAQKAYLAAKVASLGGPLTGFTAEGHALSIAADGVTTILPRPVPVTVPVPTEASAELVAGILAGLPAMIDGWIAQGL